MTSSLMKMALFKNLWDCTRTLLDFARLHKASLPTTNTWAPWILLSYSIRYLLLCKKLPQKCISLKHPQALSHVIFVGQKHRSRSTRWFWLGDSRKGVEQLLARSSFTWKFHEIEDMLAKLLSYKVAATGLSPSLDFRKVASAPHRWTPPEDCLNVLTTW